MLSEKKILNETKNHNSPPPFKLNGRSLINKSILVKHLDLYSPPPFYLEQSFLYIVFTNMYPWTCYQCNNTFKRTINDEEIWRVLEFCLYFTSIPCLINKLILVLNTWKNRFGPTPPPLFFYQSFFSVFCTNISCTLCIRVWTCFQFNYAFNKGFKTHLNPHSPLFGPILLFLYSAVTFHVHHVCMDV